MQDQVTVMCPAKINLSLNVTGFQEDMHTVKMINDNVDLYDYLIITPNNTGVSSLKSKNADIPLDITNSCYRAVLAMQMYFGVQQSFDIEIIKNIPLRAGLGGESTDAAGTMLGIKELLDLNIRQDQLDAVGFQIGADVPYCLHGGPCLVQGYGEKVERFETEPWHYLIVKPYFDTRTEWAYNRLDEVTPEYSEQELFIFGLNDFEIVAPPEIQKIKAIMKENGALFTNMTGSGSSVVGTFKSKRARLRALKALREYYDKDYCKYFQAEPCKGIEVLKKSRLS